MSGGRFITRMFLRDDGTVLDDLTDEPLPFLTKANQAQELGAFAQNYLVGENSLFKRSATAAAFAAADKLATDRDSAAFLRQATLGPTLAEIQAATALGSRRAWILDQFTKQCSRSFGTRAYVDLGITTLTFGNPQEGCQSLFTSLGTEPPLRMKLLHALQRLFVTSVPGGAYQGQDHVYSYLSWMDRLDKYVFGNWRDLIESITYSPQMSLMLTYLANRKETATSQPDENYARELMQLFSIGLYELNPDGTYKRDINGELIPTYELEDIRQVARCLTGLTRWSFNGTSQRYDVDDTNSNAAFVAGISTDMYDDMFNNPDVRLKHFLPAYEYGAKTALKGRINIPAGTDPATNLSMLHDALFNHPSTAPFFAVRMIQTLVTSNPSPDYVARVVKAFEDNGSGVRGDLKAVWLAILTDPEAASDGRYEPTFGRIRDGFELYMHQTRSLDRRASNGNMNPSRDSRYVTSGTSRYGATFFPYYPSIFGPYDPLHQPDELIASGRYAPEMQMWNSSQLTTSLNELVNSATAGEPRDTATLDVVESNYSMLPLTGTAAELIERLNLLLCGGRMSESLRASLAACLVSVTAWQTPGTMTSSQQEDRVVVALQMVMNSPDYAVQI